MNRETVLASIVVSLSACSSQTGLLTGDTQPDCWIKCYSGDGMASVSGGGISAQGSLVGQVDSVGMVWKCKEIPEAVLTEMADNCPTLPKQESTPEATPAQPNVLEGST